MAQKSLGEKLHTRRTNLGYNQLFLAVKIKVDQSTISLLEKGDLKFTDDWVQRIKDVKGFEDFDKEEEVQEVATPAPPQNLITMWPWGKPFLYALITGLSLFLFSEAYKWAEEIAVGFANGAGADARVHMGVIVVFVAVFGFLIYWFFWKKKWY